MEKGSKISTRQTPAVATAIHGKEATDCNILNLAFWCFLEHIFCNY